MHTEEDKNGKLALGPRGIVHLQLIKARAMKYVIDLKEVGRDT